jgi:hypothetical protein
VRPSKRLENNESADVLLQKKYLLLMRDLENSVRPTYRATITTVNPSRVDRNLWWRDHIEGAKSVGSRAI